MGTGRGRPSKCKLSESVFRELLLDKLVDENGFKVSIRDVFSDPEFIVYTGYWHEKSDPENGIYLPISPGSMSYIIGKLNLYEIELYFYHKLRTKRISSVMSFNMFSRDKNRGYKEGRFKNSMIKYSNMEDIEKERLVWALNSLSKHMDNCPESEVSLAHECMDYEALKDYSERLMLYFEGDEYDFIKTFRERVSAWRKNR